ncbi:hypothetical protein L1049_020996 [Liquidambar formosana]|uniref:ALBINO3-like protein 2, chloroplastic n=1 Tax=Liquidambar formosana TaxID=63359 RepID=A0AAP0SDH6_LIQFO
MATSKLFSHLRRRSLSSVTLFRPIQSCHLSNPISPSPPPPAPGRRQHFAPPSIGSPASLHFFYSRSFSTRSSSTRDSEYRELGLEPDSATESDLSNLGFGGGSDVVDGVIDGVAESILPVGAVISILDGYHDLTGLPWWIIIASSTFALRITLFPVLILQLNKLKRIGELFPKLPPPLPPPLSGRSFIDQILLFRMERQAIGCPSFLWFLAFFCVQVPCFLLWMTSIRKMSLDHHPGFDCGGILWFQNLTEFPHGVLGPIFPFLIAGLHFINVQITFQTSAIRKETGLFGSLAKLYKSYLDILTLPIFFIGFCVPQGSLVYWVTNSSISVIQQLSLKHPAVRKTLGLPELPDKEALEEVANPLELDTTGVKSLDLQTKQHRTSVQNLTPKELVALSIQRLAKADSERAIPLLQLALDKDPEYIRALIVLGQTLLQKGLLAEATEYLERAVSKLFLVSNPTEAEDVDLLILASQWAGVACIRQKKNAEGLVHLERVSAFERARGFKEQSPLF